MSSEHEAITDTVVLLYFLLVAQASLLTELLGGQVGVPRAVYDPEDRTLDADALRHSDLLSEMRQSIRHYEVAARTGDADIRLAERVRAVDDLYNSGTLHVIDMDDDELLFAAELQSRAGASRHGLRLPLGPGEAASVAIAWHRNWTIVTDDDAALKVMRSLHKDKPIAHERIRKLLIRAADEKRITTTGANEIHQEMRGLGFWDNGTPFPE